MMPSTTSSEGSTGISLPPDRSGATGTGRSHTRPAEARAITSSPGLRARMVKQSNAGDEASVAYPPVKATKRRVPFGVMMRNGGRWLSRASVDPSHPARDRHRKTGHDAGELRRVRGRLHPSSDDPRWFNHAPREPVDHARDVHHATSRRDVRS